MDWVECEPLRPRVSAFADRFMRRQAFWRLEAASRVVGADEVAEVRPDLIVAFVVMSLDGCVLDRPVHPLERRRGRPDDKRRQ